MPILYFFTLLITLGMFACTERHQKEPIRMGKVERFSAELEKILPPDAAIEVLAEGYRWSEGPVWVAHGAYLLFSDVPQNKIFRWKEGEGVSEYLHPSGFTDERSDSGEPGSNGLTLDRLGRLVLCQHGDRRVARMNAPLDAPEPVFETLAADFQGKRFNSPNDLCFDRQGRIYFTDPPYGLPRQAEDSGKELPFQGVFRIESDGSVTLLVDSLSRPNGIALSPDESILYVANSDPAKACWYAFSIGEDGKLSAGRIFFDATSMVPQHKGLPDGLKVRPDGIIFATGPGGVLIFSAKAELLGRINPGVAIANCAFDADGDYLYMTAHQYLCRIKLVRP